MNEHNPYQTPNSDLTTTNDTNSLPIHHAFDWVRLAWGLFWQKPFVWIVSTFLLWVVTLLLVMAMMNVLPLFVLIKVYLLFVYYVSVVFMAKLQYTARTGDMADGMVFISENLKPLTLLFAIVGIMYALYALLFWLIVMGVMMMVVNFSNYEEIHFYLNTSWHSFAFKNLLNNYLVLMIYWVIFLPVIMATVFMPMLVIFDNHKIIPALKLSVKSYIKNIMPLTVYIFMQFVISFVLLYVISHYSVLFLPVLLLVFLPMSFIGISVAYFNIFHIAPFNNNLNQQNIPSDI